ncbi:MAG: RidA family protein [Acidimicrobiia bacterium]
MSHRFLNPPGLPEARGFSHLALPASGQIVYLAGQTGLAADGILEPDLISQFGRACHNVAGALAAAGGRATDLVSLHIYVTDIEDYRSHLRELGSVYREVFGRHYPPMALLGVKELFDPAAQVELVGVGVISDQS